MQRSSLETADFHQLESGPMAPEMDVKSREILGMADAMQFVSDVAGDTARAIDESVVCGIQERVMGYFAPEVRGTYRDFDLDIHRSSHIPPHYSRVRGLMREFGKNLEFRADLLTEEGASVGSVIELAAWAHCEVVGIHPFRDGNGRTARLLADLILTRYGLYPLRDFGDRETYINTLRRVDEMGDNGPFAQYVAGHEQVAQQAIIDRVLGEIGETAGESMVIRKMVDDVHELGKIAAGKL